MLGDLLDDRRNLNIYIYNKMIEMMEKMEKLNVPIYYILGNHDVFYKNDNSVNAIKPILKNFKNQILIDEPTEVKYEGNNFVLFPWINNENYTDSFKYLKDKEPDIFDSYILGHFAFGGLMPFQKEDEKLNIKYFKQYKGVFSGHYHVRVKDENIHYVGSILDFRWGEEISKHGFCILENDKPKYINVENIHKKYTIKSEENLQEVLETCKNQVIKLIITKRLKINSNKYDYYILNIDKKSHELQVLLANDLFLPDAENEIVNNMKTFEEFIDDYFENKQYGNNINNNTLKKLFLKLYESSKKKEI